MTTIFFFRRNGIEIYTDPQQGPFIFPFPENAVRHLEVVDKQALQASLESFLQTTPIQSKNIIFLLSEEIVFHAVSADKDPAQQKQFAQHFFDEVPIDPLHEAKGEWFTGEQFHCFAVNMVLYVLIKKCLEQTSLHNQVISILPAFFFGQIDNVAAQFGGQASLTADAYALVIKNIHSYQKFDLLAQVPVIKTKPKAMTLEIKGSKQDNIIAAVAFVIFFVFVIIGLLWILKQQASDVRRISPSPVLSVHSQ